MRCGPGQGNYSGQPDPARWPVGGRGARPKANQTMRRSDDQMIARAQAHLNADQMVTRSWLWFFAGMVGGRHFHFLIFSFSDRLIPYVLLFANSTGACPSKDVGAKLTRFRMDRP